MTSELQATLTRLADAGVRSACVAIRRLDGSIHILLRDARELERLALATDQEIVFADDTAHISLGRATITAPTPLSSGDLREPA